MIAIYFICEQDGAEFHGSNEETEAIKHLEDNPNHTLKQVAKNVN